MSGSFVDQFSFTPQAWEKKENPQAFDQFTTAVVHPKPAQHMLGLVGGNEVGIPDWGKMRDMESDLRGTTRANTFCPKRQHTPLTQTATTVTRNTPKETVTVQIKPTALPQVQAWAYPSVLAPEPFVHTTCAQPWKY
jgi:hypothetical protein